MIDLNSFSNISWDVAMAANFEASLSNRVSISTFDEWQHGYFSVLLTRGRHCYVGRAIF